MSLHDNVGHEAGATKRPNYLAQLVLRDLTELANEDGVAPLDRQLLADKYGVTIRTIQRAQARLMKAGLLVRVGVRGRNRLSIFRVSQ